MNKAIIFFSQEATDHKIQLFSENKKSCAKQNCFGKVLCFWRKNENFDDFHDLFTKSFFDRWRPFQAKLNRFRYFFLILTKCITANVSTRFFTQNSPRLACRVDVSKLSKTWGRLLRAFQMVRTYFLCVELSFIISSRRCDFRGSADHQMKL